MTFVSCANYRCESGHHGYVGSVGNVRLCSRWQQCRLWQR